MPETLYGRTVVLLRPPTPYLRNGAVVLREAPGRHPLTGGGLLDVTYWELRWPGGDSTWHLRHEFEVTNLD